MIHDFEDNCKGKQNCILPIKIPLAVSPACKQMGSESKLYIRSICIADIILFPSLGIEVERLNLTWCIVILDMLVCVLIVGNYLYIRHYSLREAGEVDIAGV